MSVAVISSRIRKGISTCLASKLGTLASTLSFCSTRNIYLINSKVHVSRDMSIVAMASEKSALVVLATGAEEMETVITVDVLRRAKINVTLAGLEGSDPVVCSRGVKLVPDTSLDEAVLKGPFDVVVLPGGLGGAKKLAESDKVKRVLQDQEKANRLIAAVCAAPTALVSHGIAKGRQITSHPSVREAIQKSSDYSYSEARVCRDATTITSRGPGTCFEFALGIVEALVGADVAKQVAEPMVLP